MKTKLAIGLAGLLLAGSTMFAGWGAGFGNRDRYHHRSGVYVGVAPGYYSGYSAYSAPYYAAPAPYPYAVDPYANEYVESAPYYGGAWITGRWTYGPRGRHWERGYRGYRR